MPNPSIDLLAMLPPNARRVIRAAWSRRKTIALFTASVAAAAVVVSLVLPKWYRAEATLLPPAEGSDSFGMMAGLIQQSALNQLGLFSTSAPSDVFAEILRSRTLREDLIRTFDLQTRYNAKHMDAALGELKDHLSVEVGSSGIILIHVEDQEPQRAADMANHMVVMLDRFNRETFSTRAKRTREFLEERLADVTIRLAGAESTLSNYERKNKVIASGEASAVEGIAGIIAQKLSLQVRRGYISSYSREGSPELRQIEAEMAAFDRELSKLPGLKQEGARLALDAEVQRKVFTLLTAQYEEARVQEMRDTPTVTLLDAARAPLVRARPQRSTMVIAATGLALLASILYVAISLPKPEP